MKQWLRGLALLANLVFLAYMAEEATGDFYVLILVSIAVSNLLAITLPLNWNLTLLTAAALLGSAFFLVGLTYDVVANPHGLSVTDPILWGFIMLSVVSISAISSYRRSEVKYLIFTEEE